MNTFQLLKEVDGPGDYWCIERFNTSDGIRSRAIPLLTNDEASARRRMDERKHRSKET